ncbi:MAG: SemiSWEET transporter [Methanomassiliicoccales archaeon]|nr:MAG: SemiSWEET transporter [Methanomassiliicoccales archaeon]
MDHYLVLGLLAGLLTTVGFIPQIVRAHRTKKMDDVSLFMPILLAIGMSLWLLYGALQGDVPIVMWNAIGLSLNLALIFMKVRSSF